MGHSLTCDVVLDSPFFILTLDLPPAPLFHDEFQLSIIPQMSIFDLLLKYNESTPQVSPQNECAFANGLILGDLFILGPGKCCKTVQNNIPPKVSRLSHQQIQKKSVETRKTAHDCPFSPGRLGNEVR